LLKEFCLQQVTKAGDFEVWMVPVVARIKTSGVAVKLTRKLSGIESTNKKVTNALSPNFVTNAKLTPV